MDLSKFFHIRTTLSISRHRDIVEQEMSSFLQKQYPRITVESAKTVFGAMMELLTRCQSYEALDKNALFTESQEEKRCFKIRYSLPITLKVATYSFDCLSQTESKSTSAPKV